MSVSASAYHADTSLPTSVIKRHKFAALAGMVGDTIGLRCLDLGSDNGLTSFFLRQGGGDWVSADLDEEAVASIRRVVGDPVHQLQGPTTPFATGEFDLVVIVDLLEHMDDDRAFVTELFRILKPGGLLVVNVPHARGGLLRRLRLALGETDESHGHVRPGYTRDGLRTLLDGRFRVMAERTYGKAFSELLDIATRVATRAVKGESGGAKGVIVVEGDVERHRRLFELYDVVRPLLGWFARLDRLLPWSAGHMLIVRAVSLKETS
jgi:SAM-dependent methyltransferase